MPHDLALIIALALPVLIFVVLRVNAAMVFLSLCLGEILVQYVAQAANDMLKGSMPHVSQVSTSTLQIVVLLAPAVVTTIVTAFSLHSRLKTFGNIVPAVGAGALAVLLAVPLLPTALRLSLETQTTWQYLSNAEALVIGVGGLVSLVFLWAQRASFKQRDKRRH
jgi:hypothetical protein